MYLRNANVTSQTIYYHLLGWAIVTMLYVGVFVMLTSWPYVLFYSLLQVVLMAILFYVNAELLIPRYFETHRLVRYLVLTTGLFLLVGGIRIWASDWVDSSPQPPFYLPRIRLYTFPLLTSLATLVFSTFYTLFQIRYQKEKQHLQIISEQREAQLQFLRGQINPHFLFNTLNNIYALTVTKSDRAPQMILGLSDLLRYLVYDSQQKKVSLSTEVEQISRFISLFQLRYPTPLTINFRTEGELHHVFIEPMILIPLVENCLKHTDLGINVQGFVTIELITNQRQVQFRTSNSYLENDTQKDSTGGVGLVNIRQRLQLNYPNRHQLTYVRGQGQFNLSLTVLYETDEDFTR